MNWAQFFERQGKMAAQVEQATREVATANKKLDALASKFTEVKSLQDQQRGAYKAAVAIGSLIGALVVIAARLIGLWR